MSNELLTVQEAAAVLKTSTETIRRYVRSRRLRALKLGRQWRIRRQDLEGLLTEVDARAK